MWCSLGKTQWKIFWIFCDVCCAAARCGGEGSGGGDGAQQRWSLSDPGERISQEEDGLHAHERLLQVNCSPTSDHTLLFPDKVPAGVAGLFTVVVVVVVVYPLVSACVQSLPLRVLGHHPHEGDHSGRRGAGEDRQTQSGNNLSERFPTWTLNQYVQASTPVSWQ